MAKKLSMARQSGAEGNLAFTISEASRITNVSRSTLRIWENVGLTRPTRTRSGYRTYSSEQIERLKQIQRLRTEKNLNVAAIRHLIGAEKQHADAPVPSQGAHSIGDQLRQLREKRALTISKRPSAPGFRAAI